MRILQSKVLHVGFAMLLLFVPFLLLVRSDVLYLYTGCTLITTTFVFMHAYWPAMQISINTTADRLLKVDILTLALFVVFCTSGIRETYTVFVREFHPLPPGHGRPEAYFILPAFLQYAMLVAGLLAVSARNDKMGPVFMRRVPGWPRGVVAVVSGFFMATMFYIARP